MIQSPYITAAVAEQHRNDMLRTAAEYRLAAEASRTRATRRRFSLRRLAGGPQSKKARIVEITSSAAA